MTLNVVSLSSLNEGIDLGSILALLEDLKFCSQKNENDLVTKEDRDKFQCLI